MMKPVNAPERPRSNHQARALASAILLVLLPLVAYLPAYDAGFYSDDQTVVLQNERLRTAEGLAGIWTDLHGTDGVYYPLTFTTYWVDYQLWGTNPSGYHAANIILHALNSLLVWIVFQRLRLPGAWFAAAVFALHPANVESVAWVTERRNTLSTLFYLLSTLAYLRFRPLGPPPPGTSQLAAGPRNPGSPSLARGSRAAYAASLALFLAALLSKTFTLSLPAALLVVTWWKKGRLGRRDWLPLIPFFLLGIALSLWTAGLERALIARGGPGWGEYAPAERLIIAGRAVWFYLGKLLLPTNLSFVYPQWTIDPTAWTQYLYPAAAVAIVLALYSGRRSIGRAPASGFLFFFGTLVPVLGFVDYFYMTLSFVADRFLYLPGLGIIALVTGYATTGLRRAFPGARWVPIAVGASVLAVLATGTVRRSVCFETPETLYSDVLAEHPDSWVGHFVLGTDFLVSRRPADALPHLEEALRLKSNYPSIRGYLGVAYSQLGRHEDSFRHFQDALARNPNDAEIHTNFGVALVNVGRYDEAIEEYAAALRIKPGYAPALRNLTRIVLHRFEMLLQEGRPEEAAAFARRARELSRAIGADLLAAQIEERVRRLTPSAPEE